MNLSAYALIAIFALLGTLSAQTVVHVDAQATGAGDGTSWTDAYPDLQAALSVTTSGEIWVAAGSYYPGPAGNPNATFQLVSGLQIYGGFSGVETTRDQRDPALNPTILSGDIDQNDVFAAGREWWRPNWNFNSGNAAHIVTGSGADQTARLDGFRVIQGRGAGGGFGIGGSGFYCLTGDPTIANCAFARCAFGKGATAYLQNSNVTFESCDFDDGYTAGEDSSGVYLDGGNVVDFNRCRFRNHYDVVYSYNHGGAALYVNATDQVALGGCEFSLNRTGCFFAMGQPDAAYGGGIYNLAHGTTVDDCRFIDNEAHGGAAIYTWGEMTVRNSIFHDNFVHPYPISPVVERGDTGAGIMTRGSNNLTTEVIGCSFQGNVGGKGVGVYALSHVIAFRNSINWGNIGTDTGVFILKIQQSGDVDEEYSCIQGILTQEPGEDPPNPADFPGCIDQDPLFRDVANHDFSLGDGSPCIDAGDDGVAGLPALDLDGRPRVLYAHGDMGALEYLPESFAGDVRDGMGKVVPVLGLNGGRGFVVAPVGSDFSFEMIAPPLAPGLASFAIAGFAGLPDASLSIALPFGIGPFAFTPPALSPGLPGIFTLTDNLFGSPGQLLGSAPAPWTYTVVGGLPFAATVTFQGVIIEDGTQLKATNAVVLRVQ